MSITRLCECWTRSRLLLAGVLGILETDGLPLGEFASLPQISLRQRKSPTTYATRGFWKHTARTHGRDSGVSLAPPNSAKRFFANSSNGCMNRSADATLWTVERPDGWLREEVSLELWDKTEIVAIREL